MPEGDILTAIDNDQVLLKKWTGCKDKHAASLHVCVIQRLVPMHDAVLQRDEKLAPR